MAKLEHLHRILKIFDGMQLTQVVDKLFSDYDGEICNVDRAEDIRLCHKASAIYNHILPEYLDFGPLGIKYRMNTNVRKTWCPNSGIRADKDRINPKWESVVHHKIVRHDCNEYLEGKLGSVKNNINALP